MSTYYEFPEEYAILIENALIEQQLLPAVHRSICNFTPTPAHYNVKQKKEILPDLNNLVVWSLADIALDTETGILYKEESAYSYRLQSIISLLKSDIDVAIASGYPLDLDNVMGILKVLDKELEAFTFKGARLTSTFTRLDTSGGLFAAAGGTSTYATVKFATATGAYNTVLDMIDAMDTLGGDTQGRLDVIADTVLHKYFKKQQGAGLPSEGKKVEEELLNGGKIWKSNQLPPATSNDGVLLLVRNERINYEIKTPIGLGTVGNWTWNPRTARYDIRLEGFFTLLVKRNANIVKHVSVDLA